MTNKTNCLLYGKTSTDVTGNYSDIINCKPCNVCKKCLVREGKFWCNHCVEEYFDSKIDKQELREVLK